MGPVYLSSRRESAITFPPFRCQLPGNEITEPIPSIPRSANVHSWPCYRGEQREHPRSTFIHRDEI